MRCEHDSVIEVTHIGDTMRYFRCNDCGFEFGEPFMEMDEGCEDDETE
jgi:hypothetical protein